MEQGTRGQQIAYWGLVGLLVVAGYLLFDIGIPLVVLGAALAVLYPFRRRPWVFWPSLGGLAALFAGYVLIAPLRCTATAFPAGPEPSPRGSLARSSSATSSASATREPEPTTRACSPRS